MEQNFLAVTWGIEYLSKNNYVTEHHNKRRFTLLSNSVRSAKTQLVRVKILHTLIWLLFNTVIFYMLYAVILNKLDKWLWIGYALIMLEIITLLIFKMSCPITIIARRYSISRKANFDIYLPNWLAKYNRVIYVSILIVVITLTIIRLLS
jgi:hypothetical protein